jgi:hypothetical protein
VVEAARGKVLVFTTVARSTRARCRSSSAKVGTSVPVLVVGARLQDNDVVVLDQVHETVLAVEATRPAAPEHMAEWEGIADATEGLPLRALE